MTKSAGDSAFTETVTNDRMIESVFMMETKRVKITGMNPVKDEELLEAANILREGGLVAFPTETVYGLGGNALDEDAARKIYAAKGRPSDNPLIAHISCMEELEPLVSHIPEAGKKLAEAFWPGPLTMVFPKSERVPYGTTGGLETVAIRMPSDPVANRLIFLAGVPVAAPSANTSGRPSPTTADHVWQDLNGKIEMIVDGGPVGIGLESTIVDVSGTVPTLLRPGAITYEMLKQRLGQVEIDPAILGPMKEGVHPKAPGMKYKHYAPKADLTLIELSKESLERFAGRQGEAARYMAEHVNQEARRKALAGAKVGVIYTEEMKSVYQPAAESETPITFRCIGRRDSEESVAHNLFAVLRDFDDCGVAFIYSESFAADNLGRAIMNRLNKAAGYHIKTV